ncbi:MAG: SLBB domain-containing protein [Candidatus Eisenbacteria bacterium]|nr:SLBB domain-containing protein [Candidatus Eisenbacteria bacterium]
MIRNGLLVFAAGLLLAWPASARPAISAQTGAGSDSVGMDWSKVAEYRIVPGDMLKLNFGPSSTASGMDLVREARVRPDGRISVFPVGDVIAAGRTPGELQGMLLSLLSGEFKQPRVTVEVSEMAGNQVHVLGRVSKPGSFPVGPFTTLLQALSAAGGFTDDAARNSVLVFHRDGSSNVKVARVRVDRILKGEGDVPLSRFDIVYVPRSTIGNVDVFARQFFGETAQVLTFGMVGWELFNLDRVFLVRSTAVQ